MTNHIEHTTIPGNQPTGLEIAIIGMAGRFPGAENVEKFWENLKNGVESIGFFSDEELLESGLEPGLVKNPNYIKARGLLEDIECFDAHFFEYLPHHAEYMDPQVRIFHEIAWEALENAGYNPEEYEGAIGVYAGSSFNMESIKRLYSLGNDSLFQQEILTLNFREYLSTRISYKFNLRGPSVTVGTACSTSLAAVHLACQGLLNGECNIALAGSVTISLPEKSGYLYHEGLILSPDGHCRAFDANANGTIFSSGAGVVVLKTLEDAAADRDTIDAVIKGSALNNDGAQKVGFTAPAVNGQANVIKNALYMAEVEPSSLSYVETHGTGTPLGDSIEMEALIRAFNTTEKGFCRIGSVKTNVGHLETAAGVAGLIKTLLSLKHKIIPPSLHFQSPDPEIDLKSTPFCVNTALTPWDTDRLPRRAGVSSFGIGGTNVHVVLEEWPRAQSAERTAQGTERMENGELSQGRGEVSSPITSKEFQLIVLSAKTENSLQKATENLEKFLKENPGINFPDVAYTLHVGRKHFQYRKMLVCFNREEAVEILSSPGSGKLYTAAAKETKQRIIFMFPGQGSQYVNMGLGLYHSEPVFREEMDRCFEIFKSFNSYDIKEILYPTHPAPSGHPSQEGSKPVTSSDKINQTEISQPVIFMFEYALAKLLMSWGIQPEVMIGYSFGEYTAACLSGVVSLEDAVRLVALRGRLMQQMPQGAMLSVPLPADELKSLLKDKLSIAIDNGPSCIVSGTIDEINELEQLMKEKKYLCIRVSVSHAGHSTVMGPILSEFEKELRAVELKEPQIPYISNLTATSITGTETMDPGYWIRHLKDTVRFAEGIAGLFTIPNSIFVEIGPGRDLCVLLKAHQDCKPEQRMINLVRHENEEVPDLYYLLNRIGHLWLYGVYIDWQQFYMDEKRSRIPLPTYTFQGQRFVVEPALFTGKPGTQSQDMLQNTTNIDDWIYIPLWKRLRISSFAEIFPESNQMGILLFIDESDWGQNIQTRLEQEGYQVSLVRKGETFARLNEYEYCVQPAETENYEALFNELKASGKLTSSYTILHLWGIKPLEKENPGGEEVVREQEKGFFSLIAMAKALGKQDFANQFQVKVAANNVLDVIGGEVICPWKATLLGPVKVIGHEYDNINCCLIDLVLPEPGSTEEQLLVDQLLEELKIKIQDKVIAYRNNHRWVQTVEQVELKKPVTPGAGLREKGVYLVTGGVGGMGLSLAEHLARSVRAKLILTARSAFPAREDWDHWLLNHDPRDKISDRIGKIREIEALGAEVQVFSADVTNIQHMELVISQAQERFGPINGVIHAAGVPDGAMIMRRTQEMSEKVLAPKIMGTLCLYRLFQDMSLDFMVFYSSLASILPLPGQTAYAAANAFLDAFAASHILKNGVFPVSINWDRWKSTGISVIAEEHHKKLWGEEMKSVIIPSEGLEIFSRILSDPISPQVMVSPMDLKLGMQHYNTSKSLFPVHKYTNNSSPKIIHLRPELSVPYVEPGNETERKLTEVWQTFLGIDRVGIHDNFFELGVTSLGILQVNGRLQNVLGKDIPVVAMYSYPTTALLSKFLDHKCKDNELFAEEEYAFETRDKGQEKMKELRARKRNASNG